MSTLSELLDFQRDFAAAIGLPVSGAMRVYRNTVLNGCVEALGANYPVLVRLLGEEMFVAVATEYAQQCPPRSPVLALYGARLADWLEEQEWIAAYPYVADVARVERLQTESLFAADEMALDLTALKDSDWQQLRLRLHPALRFDWLSAPAFSIWLAHQQPGAPDLDVEWQAEGAMFVRPSLRVAALGLNRPSHRFLFGIRLGESVADAAIATARLYPQTDIAGMFSTLVNAGAFAATQTRKAP